MTISPKTKEKDPSGNQSEVLFPQKGPDDGVHLNEAGVPPMSEEDIIRSIQHIVETSMLRG